MTVRDQPPAQPSGRQADHALARSARRRPVTTVLLLIYALTVPAMSIPVFVGIPGDPFLLVLLVALLASAVLVTRWADGPGAARRLLRRTLMWRFGIGRWVVVLAAMPVLTVALAAGSGTLRTPPDGWAGEVGLYLFNTLVFGALLANLWEETAWGGVVQTRLMARHGLLWGSLLTAPAFAAVHVPMYLWDGWTWPDVPLAIGLLFLLAPAYRYLLGMHLLDAGGSLLVIAVQHASWNAAGRLGSVEGEWQAIVAVLLLTVLVAVGRRLAGAPTGREAEKAAVAAWVTGPRDRLATAAPPTTG